MTKREIEYYFGVRDHSEGKSNIIFTLNTSEILFDIHLLNYYFYFVAVVYKRINAVYFTNKDKIHCLVSKRRQWIKVIWRENKGFTVPRTINPITQSASYSTNERGLVTKQGIFEENLSTNGEVQLFASHKRNGKQLFLLKFPF